MVIAPLLLSVCTLMEGEPPRKGYVYRVLVALNQFTNALALGHPDETWSSRAGRARQKGKKWGKAMCWVLDKANPCHCLSAIEYDAQGNPKPHQLPETK